MGEMPRSAGASSERSVGLSPVSMACANDCRIGSKSGLPGRPPKDRISTARRGSSGRSRPSLGQFGTVHRGGQRSTGGERRGPDIIASYTRRCASVMLASVTSGMRGTGFPLWFGVQCGMTPMEIALEEARAAAARGEVPVGAVVLDASGAVLARAGNEVEARHDASAHAELLALRAAAAARGEPRLPDCDLVVTLEPCPMCAQAISLLSHPAAGLRRLRSERRRRRAWRAGVRCRSCHHRPEVIGGVRESEAGRCCEGSLPRGDGAHHPSQSTSIAAWRRSRVRSPASRSNIT